MGAVGICLNPVAGRGRAVELAERLQGSLAGASVLRLQTKRAGEARDWAAGLQGDVERIFVVGGDGTLREVAEGLWSAGKKIPLGHVPLGNANVVAQELGTSLDPVRAIGELLGGVPCTLDGMRVQGTFVMAMVGVGFDALVARGIERARKGLWRGLYRWNGDLVYGALGAGLLCRPGKRRFSLQVDGQDMDRAVTGCIVSNLRSYAKGWAPNPAADGTDGLLDFRALLPSVFPGTALSLWAAQRGRVMSEKMALYGRGRRIVLAADEPFPYQADGDFLGETDRLEVEVLPGALSLIAPAHSEFAGGPVGPDAKDL